VPFQTRDKPGSGVRRPRGAGATDGATKGTVVHGAKGLVCEARKSTRRRLAIDPLISFKRGPGEKRQMAAMGLWCARKPFGTIAGKTVAVDSGAQPGSKLAPGRKAMQPSTKPRARRLGSVGGLARTCQLFHDHRRGRAARGSPPTRRMTRRRHSQGDRERQKTIPAFGKAHWGPNRDTKNLPQQATRVRAPVRGSRPKPLRWGGPLDGPQTGAKTWCKLEHSEAKSRSPIGSGWWGMGRKNLPKN